MNKVIKRKKRIPFKKLSASQKLKRILKIITGIIIFCTLPSFLFFGFLYLKYNEDLPEGNQGDAADALAYQMLNVLNDDAYKATNYIEWTFKNRHHYKWYKSENHCEVYWDDFKVNLDLNNSDASKVYVLEQEYTGIEKQDYIRKAENYFNNDSFWLVAPYKVFDKGVERRLVKTEDNKDALLVTYTSGGTTPGDSYLWHFDINGKPIRFQMWTSILPIKGLSASWNDWTTTESGAHLPKFHKLLVLGLEMGNIKGKELISSKINDDDIDNLNVFFIQANTSFPVSMPCPFISIDSIPKEDIYYIDKYSLFYKNLKNKKFLTQFKSEFERLSLMDSIIGNIDGRISVLINYQNKKTDSLCFSENFGLISLNGKRMNNSLSLLNLIKSEIKFDLTHRSTDEILGLVKTIN